MYLRFVSFLLLLSSLLTGCSEMIPQVPLESSPTSSVTVSAPTQVIPLQLSSTSTVQPTPTSTIVPKVSPTLAYESFPYVWVTNIYDRTVVAIDPTANAPVITVKLQGKPGQTVAGLGALWVEEQRLDQPDQILRINPGSGEPLGAVPLEDGQVSSLAAGSRAVWAGFNAPEDDSTAPKPGIILKIDPETAIVDQRLEMPGRVLQIIASPDAVWTLLQTGAFTRLARIDTSTLKIDLLPRSVPSLDYTHQFRRIAVSGSVIWALPQNISTRNIFRIDPGDGRIAAAVQLGNFPEDIPIDLTATAQAVWVLLRSGRILSLDPQSGITMVEIDTRSNPGELLQTAAGIWALDRDKATLYHLDPAGSISALVSTGRKMPPTPIPMPTKAPGEMVCQDSFPSNLSTEMRAMVKPLPAIPNLVRLEPKSNSYNLGQILPGEEIDIIEGPMCTDGWVWWKISAREGELVGWTAEGDGSEYWLVPAP